MNRINEPWIKEILEKHGCELIDYVSECQVLWKNQAEIRRVWDIAVISNLTESAWDYWKIH